MKKQSLIETNPFLKNASTRSKLIARSVKSSGAVEDIVIKISAKQLKISRHNKRIFKTGMLSNSSRAKS